MARSFIKVAGAFNRQGYDTNLAMAIAFKMTVIYQFPVEVRDTLYNIGAQAFMGPNVNNVKKLKNFTTCTQMDVITSKFVEVMEAQELRHSTLLWTTDCVQQVATE